ncbi:hypothetical protein F5Y07DRAFT_307036 [Xylaria sp. FL0933]|nr:hypothetical protein F5Y07DRAFT_307036 [Xylaria sp. FL0933]
MVIVANLFRFYRISLFFLPLLVLALRWQTSLKQTTSLQEEPDALPSHPIHPIDVVHAPGRLEPAPLFLSFFFCQRIEMATRKSQEPIEQMPPQIQPGPRPLRPCQCVFFVARGWL